MIFLVDLIADVELLWDRVAKEAIIAAEVARIVDHITITTMIGEMMDTILETSDQVDITTMVRCPSNNKNGHLESNVNVSISDRAPGNRGRYGNFSDEPRDDDGYSGGSRSMGQNRGYYGNRDDSNR